MKLKYDTSLNISPVEDITTMLHDVNPFVQTFNAFREWVINYSYPMPYTIVIHTDKRPSRYHQQRYNAPEASDIIAIISGIEITLISNHRDIILQHGVRNSKVNMALDQINVAHRSYGPFAYPFLFLFGDDGWHLERDGKKILYTPSPFYRPK